VYGVPKLNHNRQATTAAVNDFIENFPFPTKRDKQSFVLNEIAAAFASGYKHILLEAPTGFGKSPVAIAAGLALGSSYICTSTKDLQAQYSRDFPYIKVAKGKNNFSCAVKDDFIRNGTYKCGLCVSNNSSECYHTTAEYGPCMSNKEFEGRGCKYRTFLKDYKISNKATREEKVVINNDTLDHYQKEYFQWLHIKNLQDHHPTEWRQCEYFDQLNVALSSSHSILNYPIFFALLANKKVLPSKDLLILDEAHLLEIEIVKFRGLSISKRKWKRYIPTLEMVDYGYDDIENWIGFLIILESKMLDLTGNSSMVESLSLFRRTKFNWISKKKASSLSKKKKKVVAASEIFESDEEIAEKYDTHFFKGSPTISEELKVEVLRDTEKLTETINSILSNPRNWIVSEIKKEKNYELTRVEFKPLDTSQYWKAVFEKCNKTLMMSATILDSKTFCTSLGLAPEEVKFIQVGSDFPIQNRPIYSMNIAYLNFNNLKLQEVKAKISKTIDNLMTLHRNHKGIIHTTSYEQLNFIKENISEINKRRVLVTDPEIQREEVVEEHVNSTKPTVLMSPSLHMGLDLKDNLSRFQIITKVPYPNKSDRWIDAKRKANEQWYNWQTALRLVQGYGRSVRSKEDWAKTYVLDTAFGYFVRKNRNMLPSWFVEAIRSD
jgi:Rad3-related DNA helicase